MPRVWRGRPRGGGARAGGAKPPAGVLVRSLVGPGRPEGEEGRRQDEDGEDDVAPALAAVPVPVHLEADAGEPADECGREPGLPPARVGVGLRIVRALLVHAPEYGG